MAPPGRPPTFFAPRRLPRAILERFYDLLRAVWGPTCWLKRFWINFEAISVRFWTPRTSKMKAFAWRCAFFRKSQISKESSKSTLRGAPGPPKRKPKSTPGRPLIDVIGLQNRSWAPPGASDELFLAPGPLPRAIWSAPGAHFWPTWGPQAPQRAPRAHFRPPGGPPGTVFGLF